MHDTDIRAKEMTFNPQLKLLMTLSKLVAGQVDVTAEERMYLPDGEMLPR